MTVLKRICDMDPSVAEQVNKPSRTPKAPQGTGPAVVVSTGAGIAYYLGLALPYIIGAVALGCAAYVGWRIYKSRKGKP